MTGIEISLLLIGSIFMIGSFFISERLTSSELGKLAELSDGELKRIIDKGMNQAGIEIDDLVEEKMKETAEKAEVVMEKESNLKIMAISEYSDTIFESMKKVHDEIIFLYSMLNDKHTELTSLASELQRLAADVRNLEDNFETGADLGRMLRQEKVMPQFAESASSKEPVRKAEPAVPQDKIEKTEPVQESEMPLENHNDRILALHREGLDKVDIARKLGLGIGEVSLVIGLYKGEVNS